MAAAVIPVLDDAVKLRFAEAFARTKNASTAALQVIANPGLALLHSQTLPTDPLVLAEMARLRDDIGDEGLLPSKAEIAREVYDKAKACHNPEDYERLMKLYCNIMGHIEKPGTNVTVNNQVTPVLVIRDHGTDEQWQEKAAEQQRKLTIDAANG